MPQQLTEDQLDFAAALLVGNHFAARQIHDSGVDIMPVLRGIRAIGPLHEEHIQDVMGPDGKPEMNEKNEKVQEVVYGEAQNKLFLGIVKYVMSSPSLRPYYFEAGKMEEWEKPAAPEDDKPEDDKAPEGPAKTLSHSEYELMTAFKEIRQFVIRNFETFGAYTPSAAALAEADGDIINPLSKEDEEVIATQLGDVHRYCAENYVVTDDILINADEEKQYTLVTEAELEDLLDDENMDPKVREILEHHLLGDAPKPTTYLWPGVDPDQRLGVLYDVPKEKPAASTDVALTDKGREQVNLTHDKASFTFDNALPNAMNTAQKLLGPGKGAKSGNNM